MSQIKKKNIKLKEKTEVISLVVSTVPATISTTYISSHISTSYFFFCHPYINFYNQFLLFHETEQSMLSSLFSRRKMKLQSDGSSKKFEDVETVIDFGKDQAKVIDGFGKYFGINWLVRRDESSYFAKKMSE